VKEEGDAVTESLKRVPTAQKPVMSGFGSAAIWLVCR